MFKGDYRFNFMSYGGNLSPNDSKKRILVGLVLFAVGVYCNIKSFAGIRILAAGVGLAFFAYSWMTLKDLNQSRGYSTSSEINAYRVKIIASFVAGVLQFIFPKEMVLILSEIAGVYLLFKVIMDIYRSRKMGMNLGMGLLFKLVISLILILSPFFLVHFLFKIISVVLIFIGGYAMISGAKSLGGF